MERTGRKEQRWQIDDDETIMQVRGCRSDDGIFDFVS